MTRGLNPASLLLALGIKCFQGSHVGTNNKRFLHQYVNDFFFPKGKSIYCFTPPIWPPITHSESDKWSSQWISNLSNWNKESWKKSRASTGFELVTSAIPVRCSTNWAIEATHWKRGQLWVHIFTIDLAFNVCPMFHDTWSCFSFVPICIII